MIASNKPERQESAGHGFPGQINVRRSWCFEESFSPRSVVLIVPHETVEGLGMWEGMSWFLFFMICLWTCLLWGFSPVLLHLVLLSISTTSSGNKFPNFSIYYATLFLLLSVINSFICHWLPTILLLRNQVNNISAFTLLLYSCFASLCHILPQRSPLQSEAMQLFRSLFISSLHHSLHHFNCHSL